MNRCLTKAVIREGSLWTCHHIGLRGTDGIYATNDATGGSVDRSAIQWLRLDFDANGVSFNYGAHGRVFDAASSNPRWYYFPSLAVNVAGDTLFGFSGSSATNYIGAYYTWRASCGTTIQPPRLLHDGEIDYIFGRLGDYSNTCLDPSDLNIFWTVQQYTRISAEPGSIWGTWIGKIKPH